MRNLGNKYLIKLISMYYKLIINDRIFKRENILDYENDFKHIMLY